jgi:hypothetical protein
MVFGAFRRTHAQSSGNVFCSGNIRLRMCVMGTIMSDDPKCAL